MEKLKIHSKESAASELQIMNLKLISIDSEIVKVQQKFQEADSEDTKKYYQERMRVLILKGKKIMDENNALVVCMQFTEFLSEYGDRMLSN